MSTTILLGIPVIQLDVMEYKCGLPKGRALYEHGPYILMKHLKILDSSPAHLIIKLDMPRWRGIFVTGRAPGRPDSECRAFWDHISSVIGSYAQAYPIFFIGDTNAHLGDPTSSSVGPLAASHENLPGRHFHDWLLAHGLRLPGTFCEHHHGDRHATFTSTRIDYAAFELNSNMTIPCHWWLRTLTLVELAPTIWQ